MVKGPATKQPTAKTAPADEYGLLTDRPASENQPNATAARAEAPEEGDAASEEDVDGRRALPASIRHRPPPPRWPLVLGVFEFPFSRNAVGLWFRMSGLLALTLLLWAGALWAMINGGGYMAVIFFMGLPFLLTMAWILYAGTWAMTVFRDTAEGCDQLESAPEPSVVDWFEDFLFVLLPLLMAGMAGLLITAPWGDALPEAVPWRSIITFLLWPVMILASAEEGAPWSPTGLGAWSSLWSAGRHWLLFYAETIGLIIASELLLLAVASLGSFSMVVGLILLAGLICWMWLTYFRLLGRLAAVITDVQRRRAEENDADEPRA